MWWMPLVVIFVGVVFLSGFFAGTRLVAAVLVRRERQLAWERQAVNAAWGRLLLRFGVDRDACVADFRDQESHS